MPVAVPLKTLEKLSKLHDPEEWKQEVFRMVGNDMPKVNGNRVFAVAYIEPDVLREITTRDGNTVKLYKTTDQTKESIWQGKVSMVLAVGSEAYKDSTEYTHGDFRVKPGDWIVTKVANCTQQEFKTLPCRTIADHLVEMAVNDPRHITS